MKNLPNGWKYEALKALCTIKTGDKDVNQGNENGKYPFFTCAQDISYSDVYSFDGNAILIAGNGNFSVKHYNGKFEAYQRTYVLQNFNEVDDKYLFYFIQNKLSDITKGNRGSTIKYIRLGDIANYPVTYPTDKQTQTAITAKIETLFAEIDAGAASFQTALKQLAQYRQALLKQAFNGELSKKWREASASGINARPTQTANAADETNVTSDINARPTQTANTADTTNVGRAFMPDNGVTDENNPATNVNQAFMPDNGSTNTAADLLAQIQTARAEHYQTQLDAWQSAVKNWEVSGKQGKKPTKPKAPTQAVKFEEGFTDLPEGWGRISVGLLIEQPKYGTSQKCDYNKNENSTGVIRIPNIIKNGLISLDDMKYAEFSDEEKQEYQLRNGDLLLIRSNGSVSIVGSVGRVREKDTNYIYAGYLIRLRPIPNTISSAYLAYAFQSLDVRTQIEFKAKSTSGVNNINAQEVQDLKINLPSIKEQTFITAELDRLLAAADRLEADLQNQLKQAALLKQSVLKAAFSGKL